MLSEHRDDEAASRFFKTTIENNGWTDKVVIDNSDANYAGLMNINTVLFLHGLTCFIDIPQVKYLNNIVEEGHCFIKKITKPMMNFKSFHSACLLFRVLNSSIRFERNNLKETI
jgi:putative transposase